MLQAKFFGSMGVCGRLRLAPRFRARYSSNAARQESHIRDASGDLLMPRQVLCIMLLLLYYELFHLFYCSYIINPASEDASSEEPLGGSTMASKTLSTRNRKKGRDMPLPLLKSEREPRHLYSERKESSRATTKPVVE